MIQINSNLKVNLPELPTLSIPMEVAPEKMFAYCDIAAFNSPIIKVLPINPHVISLSVLRIL